MPTIRKRVTHARVVAGPIELEHLELGAEHLLAGDCAICRGGIEVARPLWEENRAAILAGWRYAFPCYAQVIFDRAPLPDDEPARVGDSLILATIRDAVVAAGTAR